MPLAAGTRLGPYEVTAQIGVGGMGEVYRARDTHLARDVAIKVLPEGFTQDADRLARFEREARTLASLSHPNIAIVHGLEKSSGVHALVMELVEGPTLADRIAPGPIPIDEALPIAKQIAEALEAAHEQGVIHRDLKPANIKVRDDGTVKVLDFGLAKIVEESGRVAASTYAGSKEQDPAYTVSPTITTPAMTQLGMILGTAAYMAPEQARGKALDRRTDIWAFGCVLFEMIAGTHAFDGEDATDTIAAVVRAEPKWDALPSDLPAPIRLLLRRCLEKDRKKRIGDISTALFIMSEQALVAPAVPAHSINATAPPSARWRQVAWYAVAAIVASAATAAAVWMVMRRDPPRVSRLELVTSGPSLLARPLNGLRLAISRDGTRVFYVGGVPGTVGSVLERRFDRLESTTLTERGINPFVHPDGQWVGFFVQGTLKKVSSTGGPSLEIARVEGTPRGATWAEDDTIVFATSAPATGLLRVSGAGGEPVVLTRPDKTKGERDHDWPRFLPGGHAVLFTITSATAERTSAQVAVLDLRSPSAAPKILIRGGSDARYIPTGHLVYLAGDSLRAVPFDIDRLEVKPGSTVPVLPAVASVTFTAGEFDVADDGTLVYVLPGEGGTVERTLAWVDRHGKEEAIPAPTHAYLYPRISPEGTRIAVDLREQDNDVWVWDLVRRGFTRVTKDTSLDRTPLWTANGERLFFSSTRDGNSNIYVTRADGTGTPERLTNVDLAQFPISLSPKGDQVVVQQGAGGVGAGDVMLLRLDGRPSSTAAAPSTPQATAGTLQMLVAQPLVKTSDGEGNGTISPDGRWIAYQSNESGSWEIYVLPFPDVARAARATVSTGGGTQPRWSPNGPELFYVSPRNEMMRVRIGTGATWSAGTPEKLFDAGAYFLGGIANPYFNYDIAKDGRFLMIKSGASEAQADSTASIVVVQNWFEELKRLVSVR